MRLRKLTLLPLLLAGWLHAQTAKTGGDTGEAIFRMRCGGCHGLDGKAHTAMGARLQMRGLTSPEVQKQSDTQLIRTIANGRGHMPAYELILGNDRIQMVVAYIREMGK